MKPEKDHDFEQNMTQLVTLLKKMLKNLPSGQGGQPGKQINWKDNGINMNICFFSFLPISADDLDEWEEIYDQFLAREENQEKSDELTMDLSPSDVDFLRSNGIEF